MIGYESSSFGRTFSDLVPMSGIFLPRQFVKRLNQGSPSSPPKFECLGDAHQSGHTSPKEPVLKSILKWHSDPTHSDPIGLDKG